MILLIALIYFSCLFDLILDWFAHPYISTMRKTKQTNKKKKGFLFIPWSYFWVEAVMRLLVFSQDEQTPNITTQAHAILSKQIIVVTHNKIFSLWHSVYKAICKCCLICLIVIYFKPKQDLLSHYFQKAAIWSILFAVLSTKVWQLGRRDHRSNRSTSPIPKNIKENLKNQLTKY